MNRPQPPFPPLLAVLGLLLVAWLGLTQTASAVFLPPDHRDLFAATLSPGGHQETAALPPKNRVWENFGNSNEITPADELNSLQLRWESDFGELENASGVLSYADGNPISLSDPFGLCAERNACTGGYGTGSGYGQLAADGWHNQDGTINPLGYASLLIRGTADYVAENGASRFVEHITDPQFVAISALSGMGMGGLTRGISRTAEEVSIAANTANVADDVAAAGSRAGPDFIGAADGSVFAVPRGATGPLPTRAPGMQFTGGAGGNGLDPRVTGVRFMDANANQGARAVYMNQSGQTVNPFTGRTVPYSDPTAHFYFNPNP